MLNRPKKRVLKKQYLRVPTVFTVVSIGSQRVRGCRFFAARPMGKKKSSKNLGPVFFPPRE